VLESLEIDDGRFRLFFTDRNPVRSKILVADDEPEVSELVEAGLSRHGYDITTAKTGERALELLGTTEFDVLLTDHSMGGMTGVELCRQALALRPNLCVIIITGFGSLEVAVEALRAGAYDFVTKPVALEVLTLTLKRAAERQHIGRELRRLRASEAPPASGIVGGGAAVARMLDIVKRVASSDTTVLIQGESGSGKELVARAIHDQSLRKGPFVAVNCSAMPEGLLESELFGHQAGAFTDARTARAGLFVEADGGTVLLDELGEMPLGMQAKLLRALQERSVRPLGGAREIPFTARIVAATNRQLEDEVAAKRFREDLYYRVNVVTIEVPPLRARPEDVLPLAHHFLRRLKKRRAEPLRLGQAVAERLVAYSWPGNVRELENCIERAVAFARFDELTVDDLPSELKGGSSVDGHDPSHEGSSTSSLELVEQNYIQKVLEAAGGNRSAAARILGFDRRTLARKLSLPDPELESDSTTS
jgi:DNA-binding NtrC family response regulator